MICVKMRIALGIAALAAGAATATPASANVWVDTCYMTIVAPCGVCYDVDPLGTGCIALR